MTEAPETQADRAFAREIWTALEGPASLTSLLRNQGEGELSSVFAVSDLAVGSIAAAGLAIAELIATQGGGFPSVRVDRRLASFWFGSPLRPEGWSLPAPWDPIAGDYPTSDGWIRLHTNAPHHRDAALTALRAPADRDAVAAAVAKWKSGDLEQAIVHANGCAAAMRDLSSWACHPNGAAVATEPLVWLDPGDPAAPTGWTPSPERPLAGIRVLDLTRVLAGPVATRFLAAFGADVLRIDPPGWDEPGILPSVNVGKRCARLDLRRSGDRRTLEELLSTADVFVNGYRSDALPRLGLDAAARRRIRPGLVDVCLDAYGWRGPWRERRGFDSLVQMSSGIAAEGMRRHKAGKPQPLPVQALDHATGYIVAAAVVRGLTRRLVEGSGSGARASLARTAALLASAPVMDRNNPFAPAEAGDYNPEIEMTSWGPLHRMKPPLEVSGAAMRWDRPATALGSAEPVWSRR